ncbi:unnamed protein product [Caenorhabditis bovis]|uniref:Phosphoinositide phospholipase C n=1 Tax=Caenorhabditis bovis TaxID=2654633 RepID=A0A8S1EM52_9PELO|nr:unnamed protein product [Caenorhabditis bovis]
MPEICEILTSAELRFFKYEQGNNKDKRVRLRVDPNAHILFWRFKDVITFKQKEIDREKNFIFLDRIYDVRVGKPTNIILKTSEPYEQNFLTIVSGTNITHLEFTHFVYLSNDSTLLAKFAAELFALARRVKSEEHGLLYHFRKMLAPKMYAAFTPRCIEEDVIHVFDRQKRMTTKEQRVEIGKLLSAAHKSRQIVDIDDQKLVKIICVLTGFEGSRFESIFRKISDDSSVSRASFGNWIRKNQHDHRLNDARFQATSDRKIDKIFESWNYPKGIPISSQMFAHWLMSDECGVAVNSKRMRLDVTTMNEPINRYFIDSSHNTYCSGNQLVYALGHCGADVEMYRQALLAGCRCIELDVWDNKDKDDGPVITHGPTAVMGMNEIALIDVCEAIKECAFKSSPYPVILSIENHLGRRQQHKMVQTFQQVFGETLLASPLPDYPLYADDVAGIRYPTPGELKHKILIKAKKKFERGVEGRSRDDSTVDMSQLQRELSADELQLIAELSDEQRRAQLCSVSEETSVSELSAMTNYMQAYEANRGVSIEKNFELAAVEPTHCVVSIDENVAASCLKNGSVDRLQALTKLKMVRVYPKGSRITSTNYCPMIHWLAGAQMVALNIQTNCPNMQLNFAMFERNGGVGYIRKPDYLRFRDIQLTPYLEIPFTVAYTVEVEVIAAYFLSTINHDKYRRKSMVSVKLFDVPDEISRDDGWGQRSFDEIRRRAKDEICFVTNYSRQVHCFEKVMLNDLSFIQFNVQNENNHLIAQRVLHIDTMNNGYRFVTLRSSSNQCLGPACLLVRFDIYMHSDRKSIQHHKQMYNPHAFEQENDKWERRFSDPFQEFDDAETNDFLLVEGTRRGSSSIDTAPPTTPTKSAPNFANHIVDKIAFWRKKDKS